MGEKTKRTNTTKDTTKNKKRMILVIIFIAIFFLISYITLRGSYLEYKELGENFVNVFFTNLEYQYLIIGINFVMLYIIIYFTNKGIKKGLKEFFEKEQKKMPKLLNKSLALVISAIVSVIVGNIAMKKLLLCIGNTSFGISDQIFNIDISYYMFQKPLIEMCIYYFIGIIAGLTIYSALYYIIVFNMYFEEIDGKMLKQSILMKKIIRNIRMMAIGIAAITLLNTQNILFSKMLSINNDIEIIGAGYTEATIKLWGYIIFAFVIAICIWRATIHFSKGNNKKIIKDVVAIPIYLVGLFVVIIAFNIIFVNSNKYDKEKQYLAYNIKNTKDAYNVNVKETNLEASGTITEQEVNENKKVINNTAIVTKEAVLNTLKDNQTGTGYYSYRNANISKLNVNGEEKIAYVSPREIVNTGRTYNDKTYELTHGNGQIVTSASEITETGNIKYIQKDINGKDDVLKTTQYRIYYGLETNQTVVTNVNNKKEYDYTDETGEDKTTTYNGKSGLNLSFIDKFILGITKGDINLAFSGNSNSDSKVLINRNVIERAKKALPYLIYDNEPYTVVNKEGKIIWVVDAYTVSSNYPYSQYTTIEYNGIKQNINYIRNSVKVLIDAYDGTVSYYITDRTDPIAMAYRNLYPTLFENIDEKIPEDISKNFIYPQYLYNIQSKILKVYHNEKTDILYRSDDLWEFAKYNSIKSTKATGTRLEPYYTMVKTNDEESTLGLVQIYTPEEKQNLISYLVGKNENGNNVLKLYKFSEDSNMVGPMQLDKQIEEDKAISAELNTLNTTGTKITKKMVVVPINNTLLYVEAIYQTMLNESDVPVLKKIVVASGNKVAIGNNLETALQNLLSKDAVNIEIENTEDIEGIIEAIIKTNNNLTQSNKNGNWEMMGQDIEKLQTLINSLEKMKESDEKKKAELNSTEKSTDLNTTNELKEIIKTNTSK